MTSADLVRLHERIDKVEARINNIEPCRIDPKEFGKLVANVGSLCDRVGAQSGKIAELTRQVQANSNQMLAGKSGLQGFKMGVTAALMFASAGIGASFSSLVEKLSKLWS